MDSLQWIEHLGRSSEDKQLVAALTQVGVKKVPVIKKGEVDTRVQLADVMLIFSSGDLYPDLVDGGDGVSVLSGVLLPLRNRKWGEYKGPLPMGLDRADSRAKLKGRYGEPINEDEDFRWDEWKVGERALRAEYTEDFGALELVGVSLPEPE